MYSYLEEWLYVAWKAHVPNAELTAQKGSISRFKEVLKQLGADIFKLLACTYGCRRDTKLLVTCKRKN